MGEKNQTALGDLDRASFEVDLGSLDHFGASVGLTGPSGHVGIQGYSTIGDWINDLVKKFNNRFTIEIEIDEHTLAPSFKIVDVLNSKEYRVQKPLYHSKIEIDNYIQKIIIDTRDESLNGLLG